MFYASYDDHVLLCRAQLLGRWTKPNQTQYTKSSIIFHCYQDCTKMRFHSSCKIESQTPITRRNKRERNKKRGQFIQLSSLSYHIILPPVIGRFDAVFLVESTVSQLALVLLGCLFGSLAVAVDNVVHDSRVRLEIHGSQ